MYIDPKIKELVGSLSPQWFADLKLEFENHPSYKKDLQCIHEEIEEQTIGYDEETGIEENDESVTIIEASLVEYSWAGVSSFFEHNALHLVTRANTLVDKITDIIAPLLAESHDLKEKYQLLQSVVDSIVNQGEELNVQLNDSAYHETIEYCIYQIRFELSRKYQILLKAHGTIIEYKDRLHFEMSQKELAFLLATLIRAEYIHGSGPSKPTYPHFFSKYFYFKNQRENHTFQKARDINKKISDVLSYNNIEYRKVKEDIKNKLLKAIEQL